MDRSKPATPEAGDATLQAQVCPHCGRSLEPGMPAHVDPSLPRVPETAAAHQDVPTVREGTEETSSHLDPLVGMVLAGRYRMLERIGRGGMGLIYKVEHTELGRLMALKLLAGELVSDRRVVRRFQREALLVSKLSHPNTVQVFDYGTVENLTFLVMELVNGKDLAWVVKTQGPLSMERVTQIAIQVCNSLGEAHSLGIIHRDIKLGNLMILPCCQEGSDLVKVLDFGLAKLRDAPELAEVTQSGGVVGTPHYMAPEQIRGGAVDGRTDIYALGAVMYRCLTGEPVFTAGSSRALFDKHFNEKPVPPHVRAPTLGISEALSAVVLKALEKKPEDRYQTVEDLQKALVALDVIAERRLTVLLNPSALAILHRDSGHALRNAQPPSPEATAPKMPATRDEVAAYERKLKRQRWVSTAVACAIALGAAWGGVSVYRALSAPPRFTGQELEPNDTSAEANELPFGKTLLGQIGKRLDAQRGDRDFFRVRVPDTSGLVALRLTALPNMPLCLLVYETTSDSLAAKLCTGRSGLDLNAPSFRLQPGLYYLAVLQDRDLNGTAPVAPIVENVSDSYALSVQEGAPPGAELQREVEPNDSLPAANDVSPGQEIVGTFGWLEDSDFLCASPAAPGVLGRVRWTVAEAVDRARDRGMVLELTPNHGASVGVAVRIHRSNAEGVVGPNDRIGPWHSEPFVRAPAPKTQCLHLKLAADPWVKPGTSIPPLAGQELWSVRLEDAP